MVPATAGPPSASTRKLETPATVPHSKFRSRRLR